jgi:Rrf2 family iron-sulfur cluster assembly transcriptional regulator
MAMVDLAQSGSNKPVSITDISLRQNISVSYLEQLFGKLRKGSQVKSIRGPGGGYVLAREAKHIKVLDIIEAVEEPIKTTRCKDDTSHGCGVDNTRCLTHDLWLELGNQILRFLGSVSLDDVINQRVQGLNESSLVINNCSAETGGFSPQSSEPRALE